VDSVSIVRLYINNSENSKKIFTNTAAFTGDYGVIEEVPARGRAQKIVFDRETDFP